MPRKSTAAELQAEEAAVNLPLRRSNRIVSVNGNSTPAGIGQRRTSQSSEPQECTPARATRSRRLSAQDTDAKVETKPVARTRRASVLAEEESQKEAVSTPTKRGRKPSVTTEPTEAEESENPRPVRGRRASTASTTEEPDEKKPQNTAPVTKRRSSSNVERELEVKIASKTPARATNRRRSSAAENAVVEVATPTKRTIRGRKASDAEEVGDATEEVKKPVAGFKRSVHQEEDGKTEEPAKPAGRRRRKLSADKTPPDTPPKPPRRPGSRDLMSKKVNSEDSLKKKVSGANDGGETEKEMLPIDFKEISVIVTPLKKRKILEKMEVELDLSIINESSDDIDIKNESSKELTEKVQNRTEKVDSDDSSKKVQKSSGTNHGGGTEKEMSPIVLKEVSAKISPLKKRKILEKMEVEFDLSIINESSDDIYNKNQSSKEITEKVGNKTEDNKSPELDEGKNTQLPTETLVKEQLASTVQSSSLIEENVATPLVNESLNFADEAKVETASQNTSSSNNKSFSRADSITSPKFSSNTPNEDKSHIKEHSLRELNLLKENDANKKSHASLISSGSDDSFRFHLSNVSIANSGHLDSNKEDTKEEQLNISKESTGSNKENIEEVSKYLLISPRIPLQEPITIARVSNVFKPNQKDYSFMEPMEVDDDSENFAAEKDTQLESSAVMDQKMSESVSSVQTAEDFSKGFSKQSLTVSKSEEGPTHQLQTESIASRSNLNEAEGSETNLIIEETQDTVNISIKPKINQTKIPSAVSDETRSKIPESSDASLIISRPLEEVKVALLGKSSSPIITKRKSRSPVPKVADMVIDNDVLLRRSKSKSKSPCQRSKENPSNISKTTLSKENEIALGHQQSSDALTVVRRSKSKSKSPNPRSSTRSPSFLCVNYDDVVKPRKSKSPEQTRSNPQSPNPSLQETSFISDNKKARSRRSTRSKSKSPLPDSHQNPLFQNDENSSSKISLEDSPKPPVITENKKSRTSGSMTRSPLPISQETPNSQDDRKLILKKSVETILGCSFTDPKRIPVSQDGDELGSERSDKSMSRSPSQHSLESPVDKGSTKSTRFQSKSPRSESKVLEESFEKSKGTEEIIVVNEKKFVEPPTVMDDIDTIHKETSSKNIPNSVATNFEKTTESQFEVSDINYSGSEQIDMQDRTEYHTAIATTNNESDFTNLLNTVDERTQSPIKESPRYDFDLDSDDDDLLDSNHASSVIGIETSVLDKKTMALQKELANQSQAIVEITKYQKSNSPEKGKGVDTENSKELKEIKGSHEVIPSELTNNNKKDEDLIEGSIRYQRDDIIKEQESFTLLAKSNSEETLENMPLNTANKDVLTKESQSSNLKRDSEVISIVEMENANEDYPDLSRTKKDSVNIFESIVTDTEDKTVKHITEGTTNISKRNDDDRRRESINKSGADGTDGDIGRKKESKATDQHRSSKKCSINELQIEINAKDHAELSIDLFKINNPVENSTEKRPEENSNEKVEPQAGAKSKDKSANEDTKEAAEDKTSTKKTKSSKRNKQAYNNSIEVHNMTTEDDQLKNKNSTTNQKDKKNDSNVNESIEEVSSCKMAVQKRNKDNISDSDGSINKKNKLEISKSAQPKPSLEEFAASKLAEYLNSKADELEHFSTDTGEEEEESEAEYNEFIDGMAEEGEEDTPSEDSNQIIDEGESVGFSSDEVSKDEYDSNDSFICDDEEPELSGDEYDLENEEKKKPKKSRIIDPSALGDEDIIKIPTKKVQEEEPKKRSRIITLSDSSDEEPADSIIEINEDSENVPEIMSLSKPIVIEDSNILDSCKELLGDKSDVNIIEKSLVPEESKNQSIGDSISLNSLNTNLQNRNRKSSLSIQENILVDGIKDPSITTRINTLVESFCSTVKKGEISLNLSLEYEGPSQEKNQNQAVRVLSDIKICQSPNKPADSQEDQEVDLEKTENKEADKMSVSFNEAEDLRAVLNRKNLKRRLSQSVDDISEEIKDAKRRKIHKKNKGKKDILYEEKLGKATTSKIKKHRGEKTGPAEKSLKSQISSFSIMDQLITDVKNRPKRTIKPTKTDTEVDSTWITTKVRNLKPSTSPVTKQEKNKILPKLHPKDFKNQMLSDNTRVKRIDTKLLLKKKGAFF